MSLILLLVVFFYEEYGDTRDLHVLTHSFPARRSSDLGNQHRAVTGLDHVHRSAEGFLAIEKSLDERRDRTHLAIRHLHALATRCARRVVPGARGRSEEHTSELQSLMRISYAVFCMKKKKPTTTTMKTQEII